MDKTGHYEKRGDIEEWVWDESPAPTPEPEVPAPAPRPEEQEELKPARRTPAERSSTTRPAKKE